MLKGTLRKKSFEFAKKIIVTVKKLHNEKKEYILSKQIIRSGTAIGALICESEYAQSRADFKSKLSISLKEANETQYRIELLYDTSYIEKNEFTILYNECTEIIKMLTSSIKTVSYIE